MRGPSDILFVQAHERADHLPGVRDALAERGLTSARQDETYTQPRVYPGTKMVVVTDLVSPRCLRALRQAGEYGCPTALMLDGLTDHRNTYLNPRCPDMFLRPAPVDVVFCSGQSDARVLRALGNRAVATGLPRIDAAFRSDRPRSREGVPERRVLVATANTPAFNEEERQRLVTTLAALREAAELSRTSLVWRLTGGLDDTLGVANDDRPLPVVLASVSGVITTPSTLMVEAMRAECPTALVRLHGEPLWHAAAWVWEPENASPDADDRSGVPACPGGLMRWVDSPERLLRQMARPTREQNDRQHECLRWVDASSDAVSSADLVADAIVGEVLGAGSAVPIPTESAGKRRTILRLPDRVPRAEGRRRVVSIVSVEGTSVGGVLTNSRRLGEAFDADPSLGYDLRTLVLVWDTEGERAARELEDARTVWCRIDRSEPSYRVMEQVRRAVERLEPDIVAPNYSDTSYMIGAQLRFAGVRCAGIGYTDDEEYRGWLGASEWDGAAGGSPSIMGWLLDMAGERPCSLVYCGVPVDKPRRFVPAGGPLELAYVGRMAQKQKRVFDLVHLAEALSELRVDARLHLVGDGPDLGELRRRFDATSCPGVEVVFHGAQKEDWVDGFWPTVDAAVLVSDAEGTSIVMLAAMTHGVVPAVTRMSSGAGELVEDGVSGVTAPVGDMASLAGRLAWLASDRERLSRLSEAAYQRVGETHSVGEMARGYAGLFDRMMERPIETRPSAAGIRLVPPVERLPLPVPRESGLRRVVSIVGFDGSPLGGVTTNSQRLASAMAERPDLGFDVRTLLVAWDAPSAYTARGLLDDRTSLCVIDRTQPMHMVLSHLRSAVERFEPELVLPNYTDASFMVAAQMRFGGVRSVGIAHTDDDAYREMLLEAEWDGAIAVSDSIRTWLEPLAGDRPCETIVYGVPIADGPRHVPESGPLEIAYIGRVVQSQKRVMDLVPVVETLSRLGVPARLHIVGDGTDLGRLRHAMKQSAHTGVVIVYHGARDAAWVDRFLDTIDVCLLVSEAEGTSISMLEAMGRGVVPAVTEVSSGAADWVEDGFSGLAAPVGDPEQMGERLAWLAKHRDRVRELGAEAHRRVRQSQSLEIMAERYAALFERVLERPVDARQSPAGLVPMEPMRWATGANGDPEEEREWAERWLREAGFARVATRAGEPGDVLFLPAGSDDISASDAGMPVVRSVSGWCRDDLCAPVERLVEAGCRRIAIFGLGRHTQWRSGVFDRADLPVVGIIDDAPPPSGEAFGLPVVTPGHAISDLRIDGVLISSDTWEDDMYERTAAMRGAGVTVHKIYGKVAQAATV